MTPVLYMIAKPNAQKNSFALGDILIGDSLIVDFTFAYICPQRAINTIGDQCKKKGNPSL